MHKHYIWASRRRHPYLASESPGSYSEVKLSDAILILGGVSFGRKTLEYAAERLV